MTAPFNPADFITGTYNTRRKSDGFYETTNNGFKIKHIRTGITVERCDAKSVHMNRIHAWDEMVIKLEQAQNEAEIAEEPKSFTNKNMREPVPRKPHIALIKGLWRVSPWKQNTGDTYYEAHAFVRQLNAAIRHKGT